MGWSAQRTKVWAVVVSAASVVACTADIRPDSSAPNSADKARAILERCADAHGGKKAFLATGNFRFDMTDEWPHSVSYSLMCPFPEQKQAFKVEMLSGTDDGRMTFTAGPWKDQAWGVQNWVTYKITDTAHMRFDAPESPDADVKFWVPTVAYFPVMPFRLLEAEIIEYAGTQTISGIECDVVYLTWKSRDAQRDIDQYVTYIDKKTGILRWVTFTIRDGAPFAVGTMAFSDHRDVKGFKIPFQMRTVDEPGATEIALHEFKIQAAYFSARVSMGHFRPKGELSGNK